MTTTPTHSFSVTETAQPGGGWLVHHTSSTPMPSDPFADPQRGTYLAFRTLAHARTYIASIVQIEKRVRLVKHSETHYTYER